MTKVVIDSFDTEEQAVAFVDWFKKISDKHDRCNLVTTAGGVGIDFDGVDLVQTTKEQITVNITVYNLEEDEGF